LFFWVWSEVPNLVQSFLTRDDEWGFRSDVFRWIELWKINSIPSPVGGCKHGFYFPFHIWDVILPIDELKFFKMVKTTNQFWLI
jgi:hypothetical protein